MYDETWYSESLRLPNEDALKLSFRPDLIHPFASAIDTELIIPKTMVSSIFRDGVNLDSLLALDHFRYASNLTPSLHTSACPMDQRKNTRITVRSLWRGGIGRKDCILSESGERRKKPKCEKGDVLCLFNSVSSNITKR